jgi:S-DNA-T family DNA segregation ATPase FtsK/SpoIIIE
VRLILIDPKQVEMGQYGRLPHLLTQPVTNPKKAANALAWAVREMERRYDLLAEVGFRDLTGYNAAYDRGELVAEPGAERIYERLPFIVVVVDELNDLMMVAARDVEDSITRIAQKARAVGIHLIVATQRPSVNVITGVIKANIPARMAYAVSSLTDSRVILDQPGAERLVGKGDLLLLGSTSNVAQRIQGAWVSEDEVRAVVAQWRRQCPEPTYVTGVEGDETAAGSAGSMPVAGADDEDDEGLVRQALELVVRSQLGSTSMLQRKLKVGFARAGRLMDLLEQRGVVGPSEGSKARQVLMTVEELEAAAGRTS